MSRKKSSEFALSSDAAHTAREHCRLDQRYRLAQHTAVTAEAAARRRAIGNLLVIVLAVTACFMAAHALKNEQRLQQLQLEQVR
jgi:hypothetical protein